MEQDFEYKEQGRLPYGSIALVNDLEKNRVPSGFSKAEAFDFSACPSVIVKLMENEMQRKFEDFEEFTHVDVLFGLDMYDVFWNAADGDSFELEEIEDFIDHKSLMKWLKEHTKMEGMLEVVLDMWKDNDYSTGYVLPWFINRETLSEKDIYIWARREGWRDVNVEGEKRFAEMDRMTVQYFVELLNINGSRQHGIQYKLDEILKKDEPLKFAFCVKCDYDELLREK